ncbi:MAG: hypothetical protein ACRDTH_11010 [Pseudonocardiaceae bacterium]
MIWTLQQGSSPPATSEKIIYTHGPAVPALREALGDVATVVAAGEPIDLGVVLDDLGEHKVERLMVEYFVTAPG